jgi:streptomycin 6-kinase
MPERELPPSFVRNVTGAFAEGRQWLDRLPQLIDGCSQKWNLCLAGDPFELSFNYVVPVLRAGKFAAVLKLGVPTAEFSSEARALRTFDGHGSVRLLESDESLGALLLERVTPGNTLATLHDETQATEIAARTMLKLWQAPIGSAEFRSLESWTGGLGKLRARFSGSTGPLDARLVDVAENIRAELLQGEPSSVLLHSDLHHFNLLYGTQAGWVAIDPKGVIGDPSYEPASFLLNPSPSVFLDRAIQQARIAIFAEHLNMDRQRILKWAFFHAVLSSWWTIEDGGQNWDDSISGARVLLSLLYSSV